MVSRVRFNRRRRSGRTLLDSAAMTPFTQQVQDWQMFYATVAAACATLTGLLFVALSINLDLLRRDSEALWVAQQAFGEFLLVLMVALVFLIPHLGPLGLGVALLSLGAAYTLSIATRFLNTVRRPRRKQTVGAFFRGFGLSLAGCLGVIIIGVFMLLGYAEALYGLVFMLTALLASASENAWSLLVQARDQNSPRPPPAR